MSSMHSLLNSFVAAGSLYGWRVDALVLSGVLWAASEGYSQLRFAVR